MALRLVVGCPVANRDWVLADWFDALAAQTVRPDALVFVHSGETFHDATYRALHAGMSQLGCDVRNILHDPTPPHPREDNERFRTLARCRNTLLAMARAAQADVFLSLDSDILLCGEDSVERLLAPIRSGQADVTSLLTWFHPAGPGAWAVNAGRWAEPAGGDPGRRAWERMPATLAGEPPVSIDIPMGAIAMSRWVIDRCQYRWHQSGEDLGFAIDLDRHGARCLWLTDTPAFHVWSPAHLAEAREYVTSARTGG